jgi:hypothetical protein
MTLCVLRFLPFCDRAQIIISSVTGLTLIKLIKLGIKVSLLDSKLVELEVSEQTEDIKANLVYSLVSLDD